MQKIFCSEPLSEPLDSEREEIRDQWGEARPLRDEKEALETKNLNKNGGGIFLKQTNFRRFIRHRGSLQIWPGVRFEEQEEIEQNQKRFGLDDQSEDLSPPEQMEIEVSEMSAEELFSPKNTADTRPAADPSFLSPLESKSSSNTQNTASIQLELNGDPPLSRRQKVERYLRKKHNRTFKKKISYHCRKTVAQSRLRVKGRFITRSVAESILGTDLSRLCNNQIKALLERHFSH